MNRKITLGISFLLLMFLIFYFLNKRNKVETKFIGEYNFKIFNDSLFKNSYLYDSYGYLISDYNLKSIGIEILSNKEINDEKGEYIFTINYPMKDVVTVNDGFKYKNKTPIKVDLDTSESKRKIFIYQLMIKNKYRLKLH